jgi:hypothetical protein
MKTTILFLLSLSWCYLGLAQQGTKPWVLERMQKYSPSSLYLLKAYEQLPSELSIHRDGSVISTRKSMGAFEFLETNSYESALTSMSTNIHEIGHGYGGLIHFEELMNCNCSTTIQFGDIQQGFYHAPGEEYWIEIEEGYIFPSNELSETIPNALRTFRYNTYIEGNSSTQGHGVIGLLDEFNAYYLGSKYTYEMLPAFKELFGADYLNQWVKHSASEMTAYFEFDFFIKEYLLYAQQHAPETYQYLKTNPAFTRSYSQISKKYGRLTQDYAAKVLAEKVNAPLNYNSPFWEDDYLRLKKRLDSEIYQRIVADFLR